MREQPETTTRAMMAAWAVRLRSFGKAGLQPSVDLDDSAALLDLMESPDASR